MIVVVLGLNKDGCVVIVEEIQLLIGDMLDMFRKEFLFLIKIDSE